jgi:pimeloyl-ACP methyl ester carboxylesterase
LAVQNGEPVPKGQAEISRLGEETMKWRGVLLAAFMAAWPVLASASERVETIPTRPGVTQGLYVVTPDAKPWAIAILYVGGQGSIGLKPKGPTYQLGNFLLRIRDRLRDAGVLLIYPDVPSDKSGYGNFRSNPRHAEDARAIIAWAHKQGPAPVFVIGTSRGSISTAYIASHIDPTSISGIILTSSVTRKSRKFGAIDSDMLAGIRAPTLVMANTGDKCDVSPPGDVPFLLDHLKNAPRKNNAILSGGKPAVADDCEGKSGHGFYGLEDKAAKTMVDWMKSVVGG